MRSRSLPKRSIACPVGLWQKCRRGSMAATLVLASLIPIALLSGCVNGLIGAQRPVAHGPDAQPTVVVVPQRPTHCQTLDMVEGAGAASGQGRQGALEDVKRLARLRGGNHIWIVQEQQSTYTLNHYVTAEIFKCPIPKK
ncbi:hypothetical protein Mmc1_0219 [Magnetococcus marinus MC-1]|uniref:Uncharacterized protein n=2 Tax=Magnetococcus TaxID=162171 RepID=A0L453_MAGMM|nr:hypothetical protein Mmc1_0219 [Magnetococcus marinus MC-1]